jgi:SAM-dependent methyltransferase
VPLERISQFAFIGLLACAPATAPVDVIEPADPVALVELVELVSVRPGINDRYFEPDGLEDAIAKLESERREVTAEREAIVAALELREGMVVADLGAGTGLFLAALSRALGPSGKLFALDIVPDFVAHLRERVASEGLVNVEVVEVTATDPMLAPDSVDLVFLCDVYHHLEYPSVVLPRLRAALRSGGKLVIVDFDRIPGKTSEGMMKHVRADQATFTREITAAGFVFERELGPAEGIEFDENYMIVFGRGAP